MIDPHWIVTDLDPVTWRNLGQYFEPQCYIAAAQPGEHGLFVLHHDGALLNVVDTQSRTLPEIPSVIHDPIALANDLYARGIWERVHVINRQHLAWVARQAQQAQNRELTLDAYYHLVSTLIWNNERGYVVAPPRPGVWNGWAYSDIRRFITAIDAPATIALGVYENDALAIGLILVCAQGRIRQVTTFEALTWAPPVPEVSEASLTTLRDALTNQFAPPAAVLVCATDAFNGWLSAKDKGAFLDEAHLQGQAFWYIDKKISS